MPYTKSQKEVMRGLIKKHGLKKAEEIYHKMKNSGKFEELFHQK